MANWRYTNEILREEVGLMTKYPLEIVDIELIGLRPGVMRIWLDGHATPFYVRGFGYGRNIRLLVEFINYWLGEDIIIYSMARDGWEHLNEQLANLNRLGYKYSLAHTHNTRNGEMYRLKREILEK